MIRISDSNAYSIPDSNAYEIGGSLQVYSVCPAGVDTDIYYSLHPDKPVLKSEDVAGKVLELCLPEMTLPSDSSIELYSPPIRVV